MDLVLIGDTLLGVFLYVGLGLSIGLLIVTIALAAYGRWHPHLFLSALAGMLLTGAATTINNILNEGISLDDPYSVLPPLIIGSLVVGSVLHFGLGKPDMGIKYFVAAALAAGFFAAVPAIAALYGSSNLMPIGSCNLEVGQISVKDFDVTMPVKMVYGRSTYSVVVNWGDGTKSTGSISPGSTVIFSHKYADSGAYGIIVKAEGEGSCYAGAGVNVNPPPLPWFGGILNIEEASREVSSVITIPIHLLYVSPEIDLSPNSADMKTYASIAAIAFTFLGIAVAIRIASGFLERDPSESLVDSMKDAIVVVAVVVVAPYLYQIFASMTNMVTTYVSTTFDVTPEGIATATLLVLISLVAGTFSDFIGTFGGTLAVFMFFTSIAITLRFALIKGIIYTTPLLAVGFLFPFARGVVKFFGSLLVGLVLAGPVAALTFVAMSNIPGAGGIVKTFAPALAVVAFPIFTAIATGGSPFMAGIMLFRGITGMMSGLSPKDSPIGSGIKSSSTGSMTTPDGGSRFDSSNTPEAGESFGFVTQPDGTTKYRFATSKDFLSGGSPQKPPSQTTTASDVPTSPSTASQSAADDAGVPVSPPGPYVGLKDGRPSPSPITPNQKAVLPPTPATIHSWKKELESGRAVDLSLPSSLPDSEPRVEFNESPPGTVISNASTVTEIPRPDDYSPEMRIEGHAATAGQASMAIIEREGDSTIASSPRVSKAPLSMRVSQRLRNFKDVYGPKIGDFAYKAAPYLSYGYHVVTGQIHPKSFHDYRTDMREKSMMQKEFYRARLESIYFAGFEEEMV